MEYCFFAILVVAYAIFSLVQSIRDLTAEYVKQQQSASALRDHNERLLELLQELVVSSRDQVSTGSQGQNSVVRALNVLHSDLEALSDSLSSPPSRAVLPAVPPAGIPGSSNTPPMGHIPATHQFGASPSGDHFDQASYRGARYYALRTGHDHNPNFTIFTRHVIDGKYARVSASSLRAAAQTAYSAGFEELFLPTNTALM